jgi:hypothetical protein
VADETVTFTLKELQSINSSINALLNCKLPARESYRVTKLSKKLIAEQNHLFDARETLIKKYGEPNGAGGLKVKDENVLMFNNELDELLKESVEFPVMKIKLSVIEKYDLTVADIANLDFMIEEDAPTPK